MQNRTDTPAPESSPADRVILIAIMAAVSSAILLVAIFSYFYENRRKRQSQRIESSPIVPDRGGSPYHACTIRTFRPTAELANNPAPAMTYNVNSITEL